MAAHADPAFGALLRQARLSAHLTQEELAERAGLSVRGISDLERGLIRAPRRDTLALLAEALALPDDERQRWEQLRRRAMPPTSPAVERPTSIGGEFPHPLTSFIGRERDLAAVTALLSRPAVRLVTLTGPGGVGKTRLALAVAERLQDSVRDRVVYVPLQSIADPVLLPVAIAQALQVREVGGESLVERLVEVLRDEQPLLVLDNFEHLLPAASLVGDLLAGCPALAILVTSRAVLHLYGEHDYLVPPLAVPDAADGLRLEQVQDFDAVRLFIARAQAADAAFCLNVENTGAVVASCARLDGLPLAIELAAARSRMFPPQELLRQLEQPLALLTGGPRNVPARQQTMRQTIAWSYDLLTEEEQRFFRHLAVFAGGFTLDAARHVTEAGVPSGLDVLDGISSLVDKSLVVPVAPARLAAGVKEGEPRFTMLETIRDFALAELVRSGEEFTAREAHADYFRALAERAEPELRGAEQTTWIARLETELPNLRAVLDWSLGGGDAETGLRLAGALHWFWFIRAHVSEGCRWFERARVAGRALPAAAAKAAIGAAMLAWRAADCVTSKTYCDEALELFQASGDPWGIALATHHFGHLAQDLEHDLERAAALFADSIEQFEAIDNPWGVALSQRCLGWILMQGANDYGQATRLSESALATFRRLGDGWNTSNTLSVLGDAAIAHEDWPNALSYHQESLKYAWSQRDALRATAALLRLAQILVAIGDMQQATRFCGCFEAWREQTSVVLLHSPNYRHDREQFIATARSALGEEQFQTAWQVGRSLSLEEAVEAATGIRLEPEAAQPGGPALAGVAECDCTA